MPAFKRHLRDIENAVFDDERLAANKRVATAEPTVGEHIALHRQSNEVMGNEVEWNDSGVHYPSDHSEDSC